MKQDKINKLKSFTKEEILYGIEQRFSEWDISSIICAIERKRIDDEYKRTQQAIAASSSAFDAYAAFLKELCNKYGDGKTFNLSKISDAELKKLTELTALWEEREKELTKSMKKYDS